MYAQCTCGKKKKIKIKLKIQIIIKLFEHIQQETNSCGPNGFLAFPKLLLQVKLHHLCGMKQIPKERIV